MTITQKCQNAFRDYLATVTWTGWAPTIASGINAANEGTDRALPLPSIVVQCQSAQQDGHESAHYIAQVEVRLKENADDTDEVVHLAHLGELEDALATDDIAADVSGSTFTAQLVEWTEQGYEIEGRSWVGYFRGEVHCVGRELT